MKKFFKDFGAFIRRGNVLDLAVGMIVGTAFNKIVSSLVNDVIMPAVGSILKVNVSEAKFILVEAVLDAEGAILTPAVTLNYGKFIQTIIDFLIIAFSVFVVVRVIGGLRRRAEEIKAKKEAEEAAAKAAEEAKKAAEEEAKKASEPVVEVIPEPTTNELLKEIIELLKQEK